MNLDRGLVRTCAYAALAVLLGGECELRAAEPTSKVAAPRPTATEARGRAELLHETFHGVLQVVHHQYYREDEGLAIPAATLKKVFHELANRKQVEVRWLAVNAAPMNLDHLPQNDFERKAVRSGEGLSHLWDNVYADERPVQADDFEQETFFGDTRPPQFV